MSPLKSTTAGNSKISEVKQMRQKADSAEQEFSFADRQNHNAYAQWKQGEVVTENHTTNSPINLLS